MANDDGELDSTQREESTPTDDEQTENAVNQRDEQSEEADSDAPESEEAYTESSDPSEASDDQQDSETTDEDDSANATHSDDTDSDSSTDDVGGDDSTDESDATTDSSEHKDGDEADASGDDSHSTSPETPTNGAEGDDTPADAADGWTADNLPSEPPARLPGGGDPHEPQDAPDLPDGGRLLGILAFFDHPERTMEAARTTRDSKYDGFDVYTPFPVHGMDEAMGLGRSWIPWVTFVAGLVGFICANAMQFGMMTFDWPMIIGGKPYAPWPSFVPIMFELTVLIGGVTTGVVMLKAAGCFQEPMILDRDLTDDRFAVWISADDPEFDADEVYEFLDGLDPVEIRGIENRQPDDQ